MDLYCSMIFFLVYITYFVLENNTMKSTNKTFDNSLTVVDKMCPLHFLA